MTIKEILKKGKQILNNKEIEESGLKTKILLAHILNIKKEDLIIQEEKEVGENQEREFFERDRKTWQKISIAIYNKNKRIYENGFLHK